MEICSQPGVTDSGRVHPEFIVGRRAVGANIWGLPFNVLGQEEQQLKVDMARH